MRVLLATWNSQRKRFTLREIASLLGLVSNLVLAKQWITFTCIALKHAVSLALKLNSNAVIASRKYKHQTDLLASDNVSVKNFYV